MGVYHLAGLGTSPGAITVPLSYIYYFLVEAYKNNNLEARNFFSGSGEASGNENWPGKPEALILFSSQEVLDGRIRSQGVRDNIFQTTGNSVIEYITNYITNLYSHFNIEEQNKIKYIYGLKVNFSNFEDCFKKIYITMKALADKEVWVNLVGGANQINLSLMLASSFTLVPRRLYYVFEWDQTRNTISNYLHPINKFQNFNSLFNNWLEIPLLFVDINELRNLYNTLNQKEVINIGQLEQILQNAGLTPPNRYIPKLRGVLVNIIDDEVSKTNLFDRIMNLIPQDNNSPNNFPKWKQWASRENILYTIYEQ